MGEGTTESTIPVCDVAMFPGLLPIFLHSCEIKSGSGPGTRLGKRSCITTTVHLLHTNLTKRPSDPSSARIRRFGHEASYTFYKEKEVIKFGLLPALLLAGREGNLKPHNGCQVRKVIERYNIAI